MTNRIALALMVLVLGLTWMDLAQAWGEDSSIGLNFEKLENVWEAFKTRFAKRYSSISEEETRRQILLRKLAIIKAHNVEESLGMHPFAIGLNEFSDWSKDEYRKYLTGFKPRPADGPSIDSGTLPDQTLPQVVDKYEVLQERPVPMQLEPEQEVPAEMEEQLIRRALASRWRWRRDTSSLPAEVDWRKKGWVTPVKNQGKCGSCWSFTATGALEGQNFNKTGVLVSLSEQNLVDCSTSNYGCDGGVTDYAFRYVKQTGGIASEDSYPYTGKQGTCKYSAANKAGTCSAWTDLPPGDEAALQRAVATVGPVAVAIDASSTLFQLYRRGVYKNPSCSSTNLDHAVLLVGYGTYKGAPYWLVKNSWGTGWGQDGYVMMARNQGNMCGIATYASYPKY